MADESQATADNADPEYDACIALRHTGDSIAMNFEAINDEDNDAVILAKFVAVNLGPLLHIAKQQRQDLLAARKEGYVEANTKAVIESAARRIAGPDGKPLN